MIDRTNYEISKQLQELNFELPEINGWWFVSTYESPPKLVWRPYSLVFRRAGAIKTYSSFQLLNSDIFCTDNYVLHPWLCADVVSWDVYERHTGKSLLMNSEFDYEYPLIITNVTDALGLAIIELLKIKNKKLLA